MKRIHPLICASLVLAGCESPPSQEQASPDLTSAESDPALAFCSRLKSSSKTADVLMEAAYATTPEGLDSGGRSGLIDGLVNQGGYQFLGTELFGRTCWAYAEAKGTMWDKQFHLRWRCPVKAYRDDPAEPSSAILEMVENQNCDFGVDRGQPPNRESHSDVMKL